MNEFLTIDEVRAMTRRQKYKAQCRILREMGVRFWPHPDGRPNVPRAQFRDPDGRLPESVEPDWGAIHGKKAG